MFTSGQFYVMASRVQRLGQLNLMNFDPKKIMTCPKAVAEMKKIKEESIINKRNDDWIRSNGDWVGDNSHITKIVSFNIGGLPNHLPDLKADSTIFENSDIICLQENYRKGS